MRLPMLLVLLPLFAKATRSPLEQIGTSILLPFPNDQSILGVGGLSYSNEENINLWIASSENIAFALDERNAGAAVSIS